MKKVCILLLLTFTTNLVFSQHNQPEYTSFESLGTTDMVNLATGDFTYNMPILHVPGPVKGFDLPLSYHAGIALDQEASWVGLGWSINSGAIGRTVNRFPDDYNGEIIKTSIENDGVTVGISRSWIVFSDMWNIEQGYGYNLDIGGINIEWGYDRKISSSGMSYNFDTKERGLDGEELALSIISAAAMLVDLGIVSGTLSEVIGIIDGMASFYSTATAIGNLASMNQTTSLDALWRNETKTTWFNDDSFIKVKSKNFIHANENESTHGTLYLYQDNSQFYISASDPEGMIKDFSGNTIPLKRYKKVDGVSHVHDYYMYVDDESQYRYSLNPVNLANDNYRVMGEGISGTISPYRLDVGCLATSAFGQYVLQYNFSSFLDYKVQFKYEGNFVNKYTHQIGDVFGFPVTNYYSQMGILTNIIDGIPHYTIYDNTLTESLKRTEEERYGLKNKRIIENNYIEWYSNFEIRGGTAFNNKNFKDFLEQDERIIFRDYCAKINPDEPSLKYHGIGGFSVTRKDGVTFHYALPVYNLLTQYFTVTEVGDSPTITFSENKNKFALSWLLTAITGPDYVDRNNNNVVDNGDWGYWVCFKYTKSDDTYHRTPLKDFIYTEDGLTKSSTTTKRENYYLKTIETASHIAFFQKSKREDGTSRIYSLPEPLGIVTTISQLDGIINYLYKLDNIYLLNRKDYTELLNSFGNTELQNFELGNNNPSIKSYLTEKQLKRTEFITNYSLCKGFPTNFNGGGKLTLHALRFYGQDDFLIAPEYSFEYTDNKIYSDNKWDAWGMYSSSASNSSRQATGQGKEWSLNKIITPNGATISIEYERDLYANVAGYSLTENKLGGNIRVKEINVDDGINPVVSRKYLYTLDGSETGLSSGSLSIEPELARTSGLGLYELSKKTSLMNYPNTPVLYKLVTVLDQKNDTEYLSKTVFEYNTPDVNMIVCNSATIKDQEYDDPSGNKDLVKTYNYVIDNKTNGIGVLKEIKKYYYGYLIGGQKYNYTNSVEENWGVFAEGNIYFENIINLNSGHQNVNRLFRTTEINYPNVLASIESYDNRGNSSIIKNNKYEFLTGNVLEKEIINTSGNDYLVRIIPAFNIYAEMGLKGINPLYKNMIIQEAASLNYMKIDDIWKPIGVNIQTWNDTWNYRDYNSSNNTYIEATDAINKIWRSHKQYVWKGDVNTDGTYSSDFNNYDTPDDLIANWSSVGIGDNWMKTSEITRYNHYSMPLEVKDINDHFASSKMDINNEKTIASIANATYGQFTFTSFENQSQGNYVEGEVHSIPSNIVNTFSHTGDYSLKAISNSNACQFTIDLTKEGCQYIQPYQTNFWVGYLSGASFNIKIKYQFYNNSSIVYTSENVVNNDQMKQFGSWNLVSMYSPQPAEVTNLSQATKLTISVMNSAVSGVLFYIDDFRVHPINAPMSSYVYDQHTGAVTAILDNNNIATKYEYNDAGKLKAVYKETPSGFKKVTEHNYGYARPIHTFEIASGFTVNSYVNVSAENRAVTISFSVKNNDLTDRECSLNITLGSYGTKTVTKTIGANGTTSFVASWQIAIGGALTRTVSISGSIQASQNVTIPATPAYLKVESISAQPASVPVNGSSFVTVNLKNIGGSGKTWSQLKWVHSFNGNDFPFPLTEAVSLSSGQTSLGINMEFNNLGEGSHVFRIYDEEAGAYIPGGSAYVDAGGSTGGPSELPYEQ